MTRTVALGTTVAVLALAATMLAGCTGTTAPEPVAEQKSAPSSAVTAAVSTPEPTPSPSETETCGSNFAGLISYDDDASYQLTKPLKDLGVRPYAEGEVGRDDDGTIVTYTVQPGDVEAVIGERLCFGSAIAAMNHVRTIQPGQVLWLNPDPGIRQIPYFSPTDAPAGFQQIPYQQAIEAMGRAVDAGDVDTMRGIWADTLSGMFTDPKDVEAIQQALDAGDLRVLTQMFS